MVFFTGKIVLAMGKPTDMIFDGYTSCPMLLQEGSAMLVEFKQCYACTPEGFNVCSIGFQSKDIAKMAAVSSCLYAMADSVLSAFVGKKTVSAIPLQFILITLILLVKKYFYPMVKPWF